MMSASKTPMFLLSGGAAQGLVDALQSEIEALGLSVHGTFGAVGAMREALEVGAACDVFISTQAMLEDLARNSVIDLTSIQPLGRVATGVAVKAGRPMPVVAHADGLRQTLLEATEIHCPDTVRATAGIHFAKVLQQLGISEAVAARLRTHPNGMTAMRAVGSSTEPLALGCTQITEILYTPGVQYAGDLPAELGLRTLYSAGATCASPHASQARALVALLGGAAQQALRLRCGFAA